MTRYTKYPATMPMPLYTGSSGDDWVPRLPPDVEPIDEDIGKHMQAGAILAGIGKAAALVALCSFAAGALSRFF